MRAWLHLLNLSAEYSKGNFSGKSARLLCAMVCLRQTVTDVTGLELTCVLMLHVSPLNPMSPDLTVLLITAPAVKVRDLGPCRRWDTFSAISINKAEKGIAMWN